MCNEAARLRSLGEIAQDFSELKIRLRFPEGLPNLGPAPSIRITDTSVIVRAPRDGPVRAPLDRPVRAAPGDGAGSDGGDDAAAEMVTRRWSWPGPTGKPVYNFRSEGRSFANAATGGRCLIPLDAFFEFTDPPAGGPRRARKDKWRFAAADGGLLGIAGLWRTDPGVPTHGGEAWTMLTCAPGPDVAPYHARQIVVLPRDRWADWLGIGDRGLVAAAELIAPTPAGTLVVTRAP